MQFYEKTAAVWNFRKLTITLRTNHISKILCGDSLCRVNINFLPQLGQII